MCGIIALLLADKTSNCRQEIYDGLTILQHRGQDAAGIVTASIISHSSTQFHTQKGSGLVRDVFNEANMKNLVGHSGLGHCRYPTAGAISTEEAQPMYINYPCGLALAHNGNLTNHEDLTKWLRSQHRHLNTHSDSEVLLNVFGEMLRNQLIENNNIQSDSDSFNNSDGKSAGNGSGVYGYEKITVDQIFEAVKRTMKMCRGGFSVVLLIHDVGVVAFRDPFGIRPICFGKRESSTLSGGIDYCMASESVVLDAFGFELIRDILPGECIVCLPMIPEKPRKNKGFYHKLLVDNNTFSYLGESSKLAASFHNNSNLGSAEENGTVLPLRVYPCLFEYVYFARPDSVINNISVYEARLNMGTKLAKKVARVFESKGLSLDIDVVIPIPDTSRTAALTCAKELNLTYCEGFIKNRYIGRTFIMPEQHQRQKSIKLKLNTIKCEFKDKNVLLVDDSIVRGNTSKLLVQMAKEAGARKVYFASAAPEIRHPNVYGIDVPTRAELIAHQHSVDQMAEILGCDLVIFQDLKDLEDAVKDAFVPYKIDATGKQKCVAASEQKTAESNSVDRDVVIAGFENCTFTGEYLSKDVDETYFEKLILSRAQTRPDK